MRCAGLLLLAISALALQGCDDDCHASADSPIIPVGPGHAGATITVCRDTTCATGTVPDPSTCCMDSVCGHFCEIAVHGDTSARVFVSILEDGSILLGVLWQMPLSELNGTRNYSLIVTDAGGRTVGSWNETLAPCKACSLKPCRVHPPQ